MAISKEKISNFIFVFFFYIFNVKFISFIYFTFILGLTNNNKKLLKIYWPQTFE